MKPSLIRICLATAFFTATYANAQITVDFENENPGEEMGAEAWAHYKFLDLSWTEGTERTFIDTLYARSGKQSLRVNYPTGGVGPGETGHQAPCGLEPADEYYFTYWLRFSENFSWGSENEGGKLPGFSGGEKCSGGQHCDGTNGFTARFMWRKEGKAVLYLYHMNKPGTYGEDFELTRAGGSLVYFPKAEWVQLAERVIVNTPGKKDGELSIWFNGEKALELKNLEFVSNTDRVDAFYFSTFHGGADTTWSPENDCYIWFDDIFITENAQEFKIHLNN